MTGKALAALLPGRPAVGDPATAPTGFEGASAVSRGDADLYTPPEAVVATLVADLTAG